MLYFSGIVLSSWLDVAAENCHVENQMDPKEIRRRIIEILCDPDGRDDEEEVKQLSKLFRLKGMC